MDEEKQAQIKLELLKMSVQLSAAKIVAGKPYDLNTEMVALIQVLKTTFY